MRTLGIRSPLFRALVPLVMVPAMSVRAQTPAPVVAAAAMVTPQEIAQHIQVLAADSFQGRATPSPALERVARYVAAQFAQLGLTPDGDRVPKLDSAGQSSGSEDTTWFQRYPLPGQQRVDYAESAVMLLTTLNRNGKPVVTEKGSTAGRKDVRLDLRSFAHLAPEVTPQLGLAQGERGVMRTVLLLSGHHTRASVRQANLHEQIVLYVVPRGGDTAEQRQVIAALVADNDLVLFRDEDSASFARRRAAALAHPPQLVDDYMSKAAGTVSWAVEVWPEAARPALAAAGLDWTTLRAETAPTIRKLPFTRAVLDIRTAPPDSAARIVTASNVFGILRGSGDSTRWYPWLYLVVSASMDDVDSSGRASADRTSGLAGLLAVAKAFSQSGVRPRYSVIFLATSGRASGRWGSNYFRRRHQDDIIAHLELDRLGRWAGDSVRIAGARDVDMAPSPSWVMKLHPELSLKAVVEERTDESIGSSDHLTFLQQGVPSLSLRGAAAGATATGNAALESSDADYMARVARAALYLGWAIADADKRPRLSVEGRRKFLQTELP